LPTCPTHSFKGFDLHGRVPFVVIFASFWCLVWLPWIRPKILLLASLCYAASGPVVQLRSWRKPPQA
jgi:CDP-diacylglycerol--serine O-phosphatidyltransferase